MQNADITAVADLGFPLDGFQLSRLAQAVEGLSREQLHWASGYLAGLGSHTAATSATTASHGGLTILYASVSGNARSIATRLADAARLRGLSPMLADVSDYRPRDLRNERLLYVVISTQGEGEPPESANELFRYLRGAKPQQLDQLEYAVFGLGDSSYEYFNQAARDLDALLGGLGANAVAERVDADVDFSARYGTWSTQVLDIADARKPADEARVVPLAREPLHLIRHDRDNPYPAEVLERRRITTEDAVSDVQHVVLGIDPAKIRYAPGDAVGVLVENDPELVDRILALTRLDADAEIDVDGNRSDLRNALLRHFELTQLHPLVVAAWAERSAAPDLLALLDDKTALRDFAARRQLLDLLLDYPVAVTPTDFANLLQPLQPRLYSIASSQAEYPDELHLTVATVEYEAFGRQHLGTATGLLNRRIDIGQVLSIYIVPNPAFHLPDDDSTPVIMIGAGTGIAPFRGFLQQRAAQAGGGRNWLVFGNRHFHRDFLYQAEWISHRDKGHLHQASLAFSRDGKEQVYVQHQLRDAGAELVRWLDDGAYLYVCGSISMEKAVRAALPDIIETHAGLDRQGAEKRFEDLLVQGRYLKDVY